jgi:hypothetical protein
VQTGAWSRPPTNCSITASFFAKKSFECVTSYDALTTSTSPASRSSSHRPHPAASDDVAHSCRLTQGMRKGCARDAAAASLLLLIAVVASSAADPPTYEESELFFLLKRVHKVMPEATRPQGIEERPRCPQSRDTKFKQKYPRYTKCRPGADFSRKRMLILCMGRKGTLPDPPEAAARPGERHFDARTSPPCCSTEPLQGLFFFLPNVESVGGQEPAQAPGMCRAS